MPFPLAPMAPHTGRRGMVAAADHLASSAGMVMLAMGGSAADAIVAAASVMAVTGPHLCGLGGDVLAVLSRPGHDPEGLLAVGRAGSGVDPEQLRASGNTIMPIRDNPASVPVPGAVDGWLAIHGRYGCLPAETVFAPAIELAEDGFAASLMLSMASHLIHDKVGAHELCPDGPLEYGQLVRLPGVARTLRAVASQGRDGFYGGEFGRGLVALGNGIYDESDLRNDLAEWCEPLRVTAWGHEIWTVPPPSQGYLALAGAAIAEQVGLGTDPEDPLWAHLVMEASRAAGHDRPDVLFDGADGHALLDPARLARAAERIRPDRAAPPDVSAGSDPTGSGGDGDTTYLCAVDRDGFGISLIQSNALDFGSHLIEPTTGVFLHNRGLGFSLTPGHPAELAPGRRPPHTLTPVAVTTTDGQLTHVLGAMGGDSQPQIVLQLLARLLHSNQDPAEAITAARVVLDAPNAPPFRLWWAPDLALAVEADAPAGWTDGLTDRGHDVRTIGAFDPVAVGCAQIIAVSDRPDGLLLTGAADPRSPEGGVASR